MKQVRHLLANLPGIVQSFRSSNIFFVVRNHAKRQYGILMSTAFCQNYAVRERFPPPGH